jgi:two-component sensor histidine kinase
MAFHELATNAVKHGALSAPAGRVLVEWREDDQDGSATLDMDWREVEGPAVKPPSTAGFGTRLLRQTIQRELAGTLDVQYRPEGLICRMRIRIGGTMREAAE